MTFPYYASAEQIMRDRSELARKGIARGRSVVILTFADGVLFVAENPSRSLQKVSELYDRVGFAAVGLGLADEVLGNLGGAGDRGHGIAGDDLDALARLGGPSGDDDLTVALTELALVGVQQLPALPVGEGDAAGLQQGDDGVVIFGNGLPLGLIRGIAAKVDQTGLKGVGPVAKLGQLGEAGAAFQRMQCTLGFLVEGVVCRLLAG